MSEPDPVTYLPLVHTLAAKVYGRLQGAGRLLEFDDLVGYGVIGLMEAVGRFDPARRCSFSTYAGLRIIGAILDGLREWDHLSRSERTKVRRGTREDCAHVEIGRIPEEEFAVAPTQEDDLAWAELEFALHTAMERLPKALCVVAERTIVEEAHLGPAQVRRLREVLDARRI